MIKPPDPQNQGVNAASPLSTMILGIAVGATMLVSQGPTALTAAFQAAWVMGLGLILSIWVDIRGNLRTIFRTDIIVLVSLYYLTLFEFLWPQEGSWVAPASLHEMRSGVFVLCVGFLGLAIGRHIPFGDQISRRVGVIIDRELSGHNLMALFFLCLGIGYLHVLVATNFNPAEIWKGMFYTDRWSKPWSRGQFGDWKALLNELGTLINLCPVLGGFIFARSRQFSAGMRTAVLAGLLLVLVFGISNGTRFVVAGYVASFASAYVLSLVKVNFRRLMAVIVPAMAVVLVTTVLMLQFRNEGINSFLDGILSGERQFSQKVSVDFNLNVIAKISVMMPDIVPHTGSEIFLWALFRPVPRVLWPSKPAGLSVDPAKIIGIMGASVSTTFVGEAFIAAGLAGVFLTALVLGVIIRNWTEVGRVIRHNGGIVVYASGLYAFALTMRSMSEFGAQILPTFGAIFLGMVFGHRPRDPAPARPLPAAPVPDETPAQTLPAPAAPEAASTFV